MLDEYTKVLKSFTRILIIYTFLILEGKWLSGFVLHKNTMRVTMKVAVLNLILIAMVIIYETGIYDHLVEKIGRRFEEMSGPKDEKDDHDSNNK